jgi:hypothetical protein
MKRQTLYEIAKYLEHQNDFLPTKDESRAKLKEWVKAIYLELEHNSKNYEAQRWWRGKRKQI